MALWFIVIGRLLFVIRLWGLLYTHLIERLYNLWFALDNLRYSRWRLDFTMGLILSLSLKREEVDVLCILSLGLRQRCKQLLGKLKF